MHIPCNYEGTFFLEFLYLKSIDHVIIFVFYVSNQEIPGVPKIKEKCNPATWMLDVSSAAAEVRLKIDFAESYKSSTMHQ